MSCQSDKPFNEGSDARLRGYSHLHNPYSSGSLQYQAWRNGWLHVEKFWGVDAKRSFPVLCEVRL